MFEASGLGRKSFFPRLTHVTFPSSNLLHYTQCRPPPPSQLGRKCSITLEKDTGTDKEIGAYVCITRVSPCNVASDDAVVKNTLLYLLEWIAVVRLVLPCRVYFATEFNSLLLDFLF